MAGIIAIEYVLPDKIVTNEELSAVFETWSADKIFEKTGIYSRHVVDKETALDLAEKATNKLIKKTGIKKEEIDFLILATQSPDYYLPTTACLLQDRIGLPKSTGALDFNLGCSAYIYGLALAKGLIDTGTAQNVLFVTSETYSRYINPLDRSTRTIFGDGAAATLVGKGGMEIGKFDLGTDGSGKDILIVPAGGSRLPKSEKTKEEYEIEENRRSAENIYMDGTGVFDFSNREVPESIKRLLQKEKILKDDIDLFVLHQANAFMLNFLKKRIRINEEKFYMNFSDIGNTVSSTIPIALRRAVDEGRIKVGNKVLLCGFGVGLSWGTTLLSVGEEIC